MKLRNKIFCFFLLLFGSVTIAAAQSVEAVVNMDSKSLDSLRLEIESMLIGDDLPPVTDFEPFAVSAWSNYYATSPSVASVEMQKVFMKNGFVSCVYLLRAAKSNGLNIPVIYHSGHGYGVFLEDDWVNHSWQPHSARVMDYFLSKGYDVIGIDMPMFANNEWNTSIEEDGMDHYVFSHDDIFDLQTPFYYFLAPIKATLNYFENKYGYNEFVMTGLSGGGWATTLYSAIDNRIKLSFPVAGTIPIPLRTLPGDYGDKEQYYLPFYEKYNYSTLYALGAAGQGRVQYQILNKFDDCCFAMNGSDYWVNTVQEALNNSGLPGDFKFFYDTFALNHRISSVALDTMAQYIARVMGDERLQNSLNVSVLDEKTGFCFRDSTELRLTIAGNNTAVWLRNNEIADSLAGNKLVVRSGGNYSVIVTNLSGAEAHSEKVAIVQYPTPEKPLVKLSNGTLYLTQGSTDMSTNSAGQTVYWYYNDNFISGANQRELNNLKPGKYTAKLSNGLCESEISSPYYFGINVFPNPARNQITLQAPTGSAFSTYRIRTATGIICQQGAVSSITTIPIQLMPGLYFLELADKSGLHLTTKFTVQP